MPSIVRYESKLSDEQASLSQIPPSHQDQVMASRVLAELILRPGSDYSIKGLAKATKLAPESVRYTMGLQVFKETLLRVTEEKTTSMIGKCLRKLDGMLDDMDGPAYVNNVVSILKAITQTRGALAKQDQPVSETESRQSVITLIKRLKETSIHASNDQAPRPSLPSSDARQPDDARAPGERPRDDGGGGVSP